MIVVRCICSESNFVWWCTCFYQYVLLKTHGELWIIPYLSLSHTQIYTNFCLNCTTNVKMSSFFTGSLSVSYKVFLKRVPFRLIPGVRCTKRKFFGSLGATDTRKLNFNFKVLNRRIFTRRIRISCGPAAVQRNNRFFQYKY